MSAAAGMTGSSAVDVDRPAPDLRAAGQTAGVPHPRSASHAPTPAAAPDATQGARPILRDRVIVCIASDYDYDPTGKHHIMRELARENRVVWVNYHGSRRPRICRADVIKSARTLLGAARGLRDVRPGMVQVTPLVIPGGRSRWCDAANRRLLAAQLRGKVRRLRGDRALPVQVWSFAPDVAFLRGVLGEEAFIYYCVDEFGQFAGYDPQVVAGRESRLLEVADVVFASSDQLAQSKRRQRPDVHLVRHGVEYEHFAQAWRTAWPCPAGLEDLEGPIFGFFGLIQEWVDVELLACAARQRPQYAWVLIGECRTDVAALRALPNVRLLGRRPYADLPAYCSRFNAGLLPFVCNALTRHVNPIKLREYLAAGLPVVATPLPEARPYAPFVRTAAGVDAFVRACDDLAGLRTRGERERISRRVAGEAWPRVVRTLSMIVVEHLQSRRSAAPRR